MYLQKAKTGKNSIWIYLLTIISIIFFSQVLGALPLGLIINKLSSIPQSEMTMDMLSDPVALGIDTNLFLGLMMIPFIMAFVGLWVGIRLFHKKKFTDVLTGYSKFDWKKVGFGAIVWAILFFVYMALSLIFDGANYTFQFELSNFVVLCFVAFLLIPLQSGFEEVFFRGYLMQGFALLTKNKWIPLLITSILFGLLHAANPEVKEFGMALALPQYIFFGLILGIIVLMDEGLEIVIGIHAINNILNGLFITHDSSVLQTQALLSVNNIYPIFDFIILIVMSIIFLLVVSKKYKWQKFNYLFAKIKFE
jgi:CAAX protease family protein